MHVSGASIFACAAPNVPSLLQRLGCCLGQQFKRHCLATQACLPLTMFCSAHHPAINAVVLLLQEAVADCGVLPYDEASGTGELRYIQAVVVDSSLVDAASGKATQAEADPAVESSGSNNRVSKSSCAAGCSVQLTLVWNAAMADAAEGTPGGARLEALASRLWQLGGVQQQQAAAGLWQADSQQQQGKSGQGARAPPLLHSLWANFQPARSNAILGPEWRLLRGDEEAWARLGGVDICFGPGSFMQVRGSRIALSRSQAVLVHCLAGN